MNIVYDQAGTVYCYDCTGPAPVRYPMAYIGSEPQRGALKYRCPARHGGWNRPCEARRNAARTYGLTCA